MSAPLLAWAKGACKRFPTQDSFAGLPALNIARQARVSPRPGSGILVQACLHHRSYSTQAAAPAKSAARGRLGVFIGVVASAAAAAFYLATKAGTGQKVNHTNVSLSQCNGYHSALPA